VAAYAVIKEVIRRTWVTLGWAKGRDPVDISVFLEKFVRGYIKYVLFLVPPFRRFSASFRVHHWAISNSNPCKSLILQDSLGTTYPQSQQL